MANQTNIEWTDLTSNPLRYRDRRTGRDVWACVKLSPGCRSCYAEAIALRFGKGGPFTRAEMAKMEPYLCEKELGQLLRSQQLSGKKVFIGDMTDVFGDWVPDALLDRLFAVIALRPDVTFQVLTKRAERMAAYLSDPGRADRIDDACSLLDWCRSGTGAMPWPLPNVWLGVSVEDQQRADERIPHLLQTPAEVRFLSVEPLLGPVKLGRWLYSDYDIAAKDNQLLTPLEGFNYAKVNWVIVGGESGPNSRRFELDWARSILDQCDEAGVPFFFKQAGSNSWDWDRGDPPIHEPPQLVPLRLRDRKGGDLSELPSPINVRDFPEVRP